FWPLVCAVAAVAPVAESHPCGRKVTTPTTGDKTVAQIPRTSSCYAMPVILECTRASGSLLGTRTGYSIGFPPHGSTPSKPPSGTPTGIPDEGASSLE